MSYVAIKVENLSKRYRIGSNKQDTLRGALSKLISRAETEEFWALKDINFEVLKGEAIGIVGQNGAGKSTLLKILSKITQPTSGKVSMYGRVSSLLEVGTGFHPELTGRENIYLNGSLLGMTKTEIKSKFDEIVEFSGVDYFLDTPVKHFSSGMYVRLAFSVAAHLNTEILLIDEVLAVGDAQFQQRCLGKMNDAANSGKTVLFVSHNKAYIDKLCDRVIRLDQGKIETENTHNNNQIVSQEFLPKNKILKSIGFDSSSNFLVAGQNCILKIAVNSFESLPEQVLRIVIKDKDLNTKMILNNKLLNEKIDIRQGGNINIKIFNLPLIPGVYKLEIQLKDNINVIDESQREYIFEVNSNVNIRTPKTKVSSFTNYEFEVL